MDKGAGRDRLAWPRSRKTPLIIDGLQRRCTFDHKSVGIVPRQKNHSFAIGPKQKLIQWQELKIVLDHDF